MNFFGNKKTEKGQRNEDLPETNEGYPDSEMPYGLCPRCNKQSSFDLLGALPATLSSNIRISQMIDNKPDSNDRVVSLLCRNCNQPVIVLEEKFVGDKAVKEGSSSGTIWWKGFFWWPFINIKFSPSIPEIIQHTLQEAKVTYATECYRASAVMSRRTLEAIAVDKGEIKGVLAQRIKNLKEKGFLDSNLGEWATEIRLIGNVGAHFDPIDDVDKNDANQIIIFIEELIKYIYIMPAKIANRRNKNV
jgi:hypothetical protein